MMSISSGKVDLAGEVAHEDERTLQDPDQKKRDAGIVLCDLPADRLRPDSGARCGRPRSPRRTGRPPSPDGPRTSPPGQLAPSGSNRAMPATSETSSNRATTLMPIETPRGHSPRCWS